MVVAKFLGAYANGTWYKQEQGRSPFPMVFEMRGASVGAGRRQARVAKLLMVQMSWASNKAICWGVGRAGPSWLHAGVPVFVLVGLSVAGKVSRFHDPEPQGAGSASPNGHGRSRRGRIRPGDEW